MSPVREPRWGLVAVLCLVVTPAGPREAVEWELGPDPVVAIGVVEGPEAYELFDAASSLLLPDGRIVVANAGAGQIRTYDAGGRFIAQMGGSGGGPGEFRYLRKLFHGEADTLLALDAAGNRVSVFDPRGEYVRSLGPDAVADPERPYFGWVFRTFWVHWSPARPAPEPIRRALARLPIPDAVPYRRVVAADSGDLWVREPVRAGDRTVRWVVLDGTGAPRATLETPARFEIHDIHYPFVLGRWMDAMDVNFIRMYRLRATARPARVPAWLSRRGARAPAFTGDARQAMHATMVTMVTEQERYYADHGQYATSAADLPLDLDEALAVDILAGGRMGWVGLVAHRNAPVICGFGVGADTPPAWHEAELTCGEGAP